MAAIFGLVCPTQYLTSALIKHCLAVTLNLFKENYMKPFLYRTDCIYTCVRRGFSEQDTWREALGLYEPLLAYADKLPTLDAPEHLPDGHTTKRYIDFVSRG
jgi:hypothetical protein